MRIPASTTSAWIKSCPGRRFPALERDLEVDVAIVGGGLTGVTAALELARAGKRVALLEARRLGEGVTGYTTAHLTEVIDTRYHELIRDFGVEGARLAARSSREAIARIELNVRELGIQCDFLRVPAWLYSEDRRGVGELDRELSAMRKVDLRARYTADVPLPFPVAGAILVEDQAQFHVRRYLFGLVDALGAGVQVFEDTRVLDVHDGEPCTVTTARGTVRAASVLVATHAPVNNRFLLQTKIGHYSSYALGLRTRVTQAPGLFWDTADPYHYIRTQEVDGEPLVIVGGEDHRVGVERDTERRYRALLEYAVDRWGVAAVAYRWSAQVLEPVDGLPFIGRNPREEHVFVATGFSGNGMTFGTLAGTMLADEVIGRDNPYRALYAAARIKPLAAARDYVKENAGFPAHLVGDRLRSHDSLDEVGPGEGKVVSHGGRHLAAFRDEQGELHLHSAVCTHMQCLVAFNTAERTWDCPCHGSRFGVDGTVIDGPAVKPLEKQSKGER